MQLVWLMEVPWGLDVGNLFDVGVFVCLNLFEVCNRGFFGVLLENLLCRDVAT